MALYPISSPQKTGLSFSLMQSFCDKISEFSSSHEIRKGYRSMAHRAYVTYRTYGAPGTLGTN